MTSRIVRLIRSHMATDFDLRISCEERDVRRAELCLEEAHRLIARLECELSEYLSDSPVYQLNHEAPGARIRFTPAGLELLRRALELFVLTNGNFDPLAKSRDTGRALGVDWQSGEVWRETAGTWLGFGAIGKGFAIDEARALLEKAGFSDYLLSGGGSSILISGAAGPGQDWTWGWSWKKDTEGKALGLALRHLSRKSVALGISGTHEQGAHIVGARAGLQSALIATGSAADSDALSTALFVAGWESARGYLDRLPLPPAVAWIDGEGVSHWNGGFNNLWGQALGATALVIGSIAISAPARALADESVDLSAGNDKPSFTPYVFDRSNAWIILPVLMLVALCAHLRRTEPKRRKKKGSLSTPMKPMKPKKPFPLTQVAIAGMIWLSAERAWSVEIEPMNKAIMAILGTPKAMKKTINDGKSEVDIYVARDASGKASRIVFIEHGTYPPDCSHTWAIGVEGAHGTITQVRPIEMSCPHAFPTKASSFLDQFKGRGPADAKRLEDAVHIVAKATGTSQLATQAVKRVLLTYAKNRTAF